MRVFAMPLVCAALTVTGLLLALVSDGAAETAGVGALVILLILLGSRLR